MIEGSDFVGDYSRFSYDETKNYMMVLKEQGVELLDDEINAMQEIQMTALRRLVKEIVGDGAFGDAFKIVGTSATNDFTITAGKLLLDGWLPSLGSNTTYGGQPLSQSVLTTPSGSDRTDEVYLDVWFEEIDAVEDTNILDPTLGVRTSCRWQMQWAVKVAENGTVPADGLDGQNKYHWHYHLATLNRLDGNATITVGMVVDEISLATVDTVDGKHVDDTKTTSAYLWTAEKIISQINSQAVLTGALTAYPFASVPSGWLECDGAAVSRTTYSDLFTAIGTDYGVGDGSTTFNLPDFRGEFLRGWDHGRGKDPDAASRTDRGDSTTGDNVGTKQAHEIDSHAHVETGASGSGGDLVNFSVISTTAITPTTLNNLTEASGGNETRPTNVNVMYCIKY